MKAALTIVLLILLLFIPSAKAQENCHPVTDLDSTLIQDLTFLEEWHQKGYCGQEISIGIINTHFPEKTRSLDLLDKNLLYVAPEQEGNWTAENSTSRATELLQTIHIVAPSAKLYVYRLQQASDFAQAWEWFRQNDVNIVANLIAHPIFTEQEIMSIESVMAQAVEQDVLWLNSAGNYGSSYYEADLDSTLWNRDGWHYFSDETAGLLPIYAAKAEQPVRVYLRWKNSDEELLLAAFTDSAGNTPLLLEPDAYQPNLAENYSVITLGRLPPEQPIYLAVVDPAYLEHTSNPIHFQVYLSNATTNISSSGNSIPAPNDYQNTLTIGSLSESSSLSSSEARAVGKPEVITFGSSHSENSGEYGTGFSTLITAGVVAVYWSKEPSQSSSDIVSQIHNGQPLQLLTLTDPSPQPYSLYAGLLGIAIVGGGSSAAYLYYRDRKRTFAELENLIYECVYYEPEEQLNIYFTLPYRRNGKPKLRRYVPSIDIEVTLAPQPKQAPQLDSWLMNVNLVHSESTGIGAKGITHTKDSGSTIPGIILVDSSIERLRFRMELDYPTRNTPIVLRIPKLKWAETPKEITCMVNFIPSDFHYSTKPVQARIIQVTENQDPFAKQRGTKVFISYRRADSAHVAGRLYEHLIRVFPPENIFRDVEAIEIGSNFETAIKEALSACQIVLVVIGKDWLTVTEQDKNGKTIRRIDNPKDYVRQEINMALHLEKRVIPILVDGTEMPKPKELPRHLNRLKKLNALTLHDTNFDQAVEHLINVLLE